MILILILIAIGTAYYFFNSHYQYWKKRGVPGPKPTFFFGNLGPSFLRKKSQPQVFEDIYNAYPNIPVVGIFRATSPALLIRDPEIIKEVTVKSFSNFVDNDWRIDKEVDPLMGRHPFIDKGEDWKKTRVHLTPGFTSGKMKSLYPLLEDTSQRFVKFLRNKPQAMNGEGCNVKEICLRYTLNNVGSCAFGLEAKCFEEENSEFNQLADRFLSTSSFHVMKLFLISMIPVLTKIISLKFTPKDVERDLIDLVTQTINYRQKNNIERNDFLQILIEQKKSGKFTDIDVAAHAAGFFPDAYETSSLVMTFMLFELANNPEIQAKLREEVDKAFEENDGKMSYEVLQELSYLDAVFNETLRLHPPLGSLNKICTKPFTYVPKENELIRKPFIVEEGSTIVIPLYGLHRDSKFFDEPFSFDPDRFIGANKQKIAKYTFMPFGEGPRACLGQRFGSLQIKIGVCYIISNFEISVNKNTILPVQYEPSYFLTDAKGGIWLDFKKIDK